MAIQVLFKNKFAEATFEAEKKLVCFRYFEASKEMEEKDYKEILLVFLDALKKLYEDKVIGVSSLLYLADLQEMYFTIAPELQQWADREFSSQIDIFSKKSALIMPKDIFASVATQQTAEEKNASKLTIQYFDDEQKALNWLFK